MSALSKIRESGFTILLSGECLEISPASALTPTQREFLKLHKAEIIHELRFSVPPVPPEKTETKTITETDRQRILAWLHYIGETDQSIIDETLDRCANDTDALVYFLMRAKDVPVQIKCRDCQHFKSFNAHGGGAGICSAGVQASGSCWWADTVHQCVKFNDTHIIYTEATP